MKISRRLWRAQLNRQILIFERQKPDYRIAVLGVGNELDGDDAAGLLVARELKKRLHPNPRVMVVETGSTPENFTSAVKRFHPNWVVVVDAARLGYRPGGIAFIQWDEVGKGGAATHGLPLSMFWHYLEAETGCQLTLLGIQVAQTGFDQPVSLPVCRAATRLASVLSQLLRIQIG